MSEGELPPLSLKGKLGVAACWAVGLGAVVYHEKLINGYLKLKEKLGRNESGPER